MEGNNTETVQQPTPEQPAVEQPVQEPKKPFYKKGLFWGIVTFVAAAAGAVTAYVVLGKDAESAE
jgi:hypothetical protein